ncbi:tyrosine-type recombinase/integrase [Actinomadura geliboluensis]|uniref:Site-specific integrase n=1 Tax=Actinomadura geliboluensis TaxID=882440 RepID=A0A5S4H5N6_9ACTN|nr:site-specific integrase [Actinomadura geliboluensis]TMR40533.1 site-specific integrase [Actinomadura geliboluensis]
MSKLNALSPDEEHGLTAGRTIARKRLDRRDPRIAVDELFSVDKAHRLWLSLPEGHRATRFLPTMMPTDYVEAFRVSSTDATGTKGSQALNFSHLPEPMGWELAWCIDQEVRAGKPVNPARLRSLVRGLTLATTEGSAAARSARSITAFSHLQWAREVRGAVLRAGIQKQHYSETIVLNSVKHIQDRLAVAYHDGEWWRLNIWNPQLDPRVPQRSHEPSGTHVANFSHLETPWLRQAAQWWLSTRLSSGTYAWSSVKSRLDHFKWFQWFIMQVKTAGPHLVDDIDELRPLMRGFRDDLRAHRVLHGPNKGKPLGKNQVRQPMVTLETFYRWMFDHRTEAAAVLDEPRWKLLTPRHTVLFAAEDKPRRINAKSADMVLEDDVVTAITAGCGLLAAPQGEGGLGDHQALHALMLLIRTGRRMSEVLMMDFEPISPLPTSLPQSTDSDQDLADEFVARMSFQETKIEHNDPATIPVDQEVVDIIRAQQRWVREFLADQGAPNGHQPPYLFVQTRQNRLGRLPYPAATFHSRLRELTERLAITDSTGRPVKISKTHKFRHTRATNLLNAGVPIHVVMRYLRHLSTDMTMHYAVTLSETEEREFLRYKKVTGDGRTIDFDDGDLFDLLHLQQRADRVLPNGWCMLPPRQTCSKGNACLPCSKFVTDTSHRHELERQRASTQDLIETRQAQFQARYGKPMGTDNIWLAGRLAETTALNKVLIALDQISVRDHGQMRAIRGAGAPDSPDLGGGA